MRGWVGKVGALASSASMIWCASCTGEGAFTSAAECIRGSGCNADSGADASHLSRYDSGEQDSTLASLDSAAVTDAGADVGVESRETSDTDVPDAADAGTTAEASDASDASDAFDALDALDAPDVVPCDGTKSPSQSSCVIGDAYGIFVSPLGSDSNAGTKSAPVQTLAQGLQLAKSTGKRVYACGTGNAYGESLVIRASLDGVAAYGGFDCASWAYGARAKAAVAPSGPGYALSISNVTLGVTFEDFSFTSQPGTQPGSSSLAVLANASVHVVFRRCSLTAGAGQPGADPSAEAAFAMAAPSGQPGTADGGGAASANTCSGMANASVGGAGGGPLDAPGADGQDGTPGASNKGTAAALGGCGSGSGGNGANGAGGSAGQGATAWEVLDAGAWYAVGGQAGGHGSVGQGGGGGASQDLSGGGGGGGAGGCGGAGGLAGTGAGSSVALLALNASVDLEQCALTAANGGQGGNGAPGQMGQRRGVSGTQFPGECPGGNGGNGGSGGGGGGGAGGLSLGIAWVGAPPTVDGAIVMSASAQAGVTVGFAGAAGRPGAGGAPVTAGANPGLPATDNAKAGVAAAVLQLQ